MTASAYELAKEIRRAANVHEKSWNDDGQNYGYAVSIKQAARPAEELALPVRLLLRFAWDDALDWADQTIAAVDGPKETGR